MSGPDGVPSFTSSLACLRARLSYGGLLLLPGLSGALAAAAITTEPLPHEATALPHTLTPLSVTVALLS